jgi:hypothetical protein
MYNDNLNDNDVRAMAVIEGGPPLPEPMDKAPGSLGGQIVLKDGEPAAGATVEICVERMGSQFFGETPCSDQAFMRWTETDADGAFVFPDLPAGLYVITINTGEGSTWALSRSACRSSLARKSTWASSSSGRRNSYYGVMTTRYVSGRSAACSPSSNLSKGSTNEINGLRSMALSEIIHTACRTSSLS